MAATITDVARESGVSIGTVSNILNNGSRPVREATRQRVQQAARRLNYHPNAMAQGLVRRRLNTLGILFGFVDIPVFLTHPYATGIAHGALTAAGEAGYNLTFFTQRWLSAEQSAAAFRDRRADGLLVIAPPTDSDILSGLAPLGLTLVSVSTQSAQYGIPCVDVDNALGARLATRHLIALGHTRIAHLAGNQNMASAPLRRRAFLETMAEAGLPVPPEYDASGSYQDPEMDQAAASRLLSLPQPPTAVFAANDVSAMAVIEAAQRRGLRVPADLSVVGFDDIPRAAYFQPALTTVHQPLVEIGEAAARLLVARIESSLERDGEGECASAAESHFIAPTLVCRETTAPPAHR